MIIEGYFFLFLIETICCDPSSKPSKFVIPHLHFLNKTVQMRGHNICCFLFFVFLQY